MQLASNCQATNPLSPPQCLFLGLLFSFIVWQLTSPVFFIYIMRTEYVELHLSLTAGFPLGECAQLQSLQLPRKMQKTI